MLSRVLLFTAAACGLAVASAAQAQLTLRGDYAAARGITEVSALYARQHRTSVVVTPFSTNSGIEGVINGTIDVAASARPPLPNRATEQELVFWPVAWDAVVFIVHPSNPVSELSLAQVRDIFNGRLENWSEVGGKNAPIDLYSVMGPYDGLESSIRQILFANPGYNAKIKRLFLNQHQIEVGIQMDPDAIGMTTLAGLNQQRVKPLRIDGVAADADSVANGRYLLTVPLFLVYRSDNPKAVEIERFAQFLRTPAAENVIKGKRLALHREDDDFRAMHAQRLAVLWERIGGQPVAPNLVRFAGNAQREGANAAVTTQATAGTAAGAGGEAVPDAVGSADTASMTKATVAASPGPLAIEAHGVAEARTAAGIETADRTTASAPDAVVGPDIEPGIGANAAQAGPSTPTATDDDVEQAQGGLDGGDEECRKRLFSRKC